MLFNSYQFIIFFPIVLFVYYLFPAKIRYIWLLAASYYFYMSWNPVYALLMLASTLTTWAAGFAIDRMKERESLNGKKLILILCIVINFGILFLYKYLDFALSIINKLGRYLSLPDVEKSFNLLLPVGISFYTFQAVGYIIDVYRGMESEKNVLKYALFVSFFPQLVAGPIERSKNLLTQINEIAHRKLWNSERILNGFIYMLWGFFLKMIIADRVAILVDQVWENYQSYGSIELIAAAVGFSIQIYCDFSSYSCIAIGAAQIMGFTLMENFEAPYFAGTIKGFWRRWHISLSTWFRDYLYIPLGGSRCSLLKKYWNLMITFLVSGLWHGAGFHFILWGGIHGIYQIVGELTLPVREKLAPLIGIRTGSITHKIGRAVGTFCLTTFAWIFFRSENFSIAVSFIKNIVTGWNPWAIWDGTLFQLGLTAYEMNVLLIALVFLLLIDIVRCGNGKRIDIFLMEQGAFVQALFVIVIVLVILIYGKYGGYDERQFIYFQF